MSNSRKYKVFITRDDQVNGPFFRILEKAGMHCEGHSFINIQAVPFEGNFNDYNWLFFYSKNGIQHFLDQAPVGKMKLGVLSQSSATFLEKNYQIQADFIGQGAIEEVLQAFSGLAQGQKILVPRASTSRSSLQHYADSFEELKEIVVYKNELKIKPKLERKDILVFTSPMNVKGFLMNNNFHIDQKIVAIGNTTAKTLDEMGANDINIASAPTQEELAKLVLRLA